MSARNNRATHQYAEYRQNGSFIINSGNSSRLNISQMSLAKSINGNPVLWQGGNFGFAQDDFYDINVKTIITFPAAATGNCHVYIRDDGDPIADAYASSTVPGIDGINSVTISANIHWELPDGAQNIRFENNSNQNITVSGTVVSFRRIGL